MLNAPPKGSRPRSRSSARRRFAIIAETVGGERFANHHHVGDVRGRGLVQAIEPVLDRASKPPSTQSTSSMRASRARVWHAV